MKFGTQIEDSLNITHSEFGVSNSKILAPPTVQISTGDNSCLYLNCKISFVPLIPWLLPT